MKVLQVLSGGSWAGTSVVVHAITEALITRGDEVSVLCLDGGVADRFRAIGSRIVRSPFWFHPINPFDAIPFGQLVTLCLKERFDLVVTHTSKGGFLGRIAARLAGVPNIVFHAHGYSFNEGYSAPARRVYLSLEKLAARAGHLAISVSEEHRQVAIERGVESDETICTIHNGIDLQPFETASRSQARRKFGFADDEVIIGALGRLAYSNALDDLVRAMPRIRARFPNVRLAIAGEGPLRNELQALATKQGNEAHVEFLGFRQDVADVLASFDVFVQPSLWEGLSVSLTEAMAAGKAIVATDICGNREQIQHEATGLMVPKRNETAIAESVNRLLSEPALAKTLGENARQAARDRFSQERMVESHLAVYDSLVEHGRHGLRWKAPDLLHGTPILSGFMSGGAAHGND